MKIPYLIYGSFNWSDRGHHLAGVSEGISNVDQFAIVRFCDQWGEINSDGWRASLNLFPLPRKDEEEQPCWAMVRMVPLGADYAGRLGAVLRHALVVDPSTAFMCRLNPFCINDRGYFVDDWSADDKCEPMEVPDSVCFSEYHMAYPDAWRDSLANDLATLFSGQRLIAWMAEPTEQSDLYIRTLFTLTPQPLRNALEISTFRYQPSKTVDLAVIRGPVNTTSGDISGRPPFKELNLKEDIRPELPEDLCEELVAAVRTGDGETVRSLLQWENYVA